ncbi:hypothetical protein THAOC_12487, partial [Thalassiosira oceanica]
MAPPPTRTDDRVGFHNTPWKGTARMNNSGMDTKSLILHLSGLPYNSSLVAPDSGKHEAVAPDAANGGPGRPMLIYFIFFLWTVLDTTSGQTSLR